MRWAEREEKGSRPFFDIHATIHVERDSQTGISARPSG